MAVRRRIPKDKPGKIRFCMVHRKPWKANAEEIGTTIEQVNLFEELTELARLAQAEKHRAATAAQAATLKYNLAVKAMAKQASIIVLQIDARARTAGKGVYSKASINPPNRRRTRIGPPGKPGQIKMELLALGWLELKWTCKNPRGSQNTLYYVRRRVGMNGELVFLGTTGKKKFLDETLPAGSARVEYEVQAVRGKTKGETATHLVYLGTNQKTPRSMHLKKQFPPLAA